MSRRKRKGTLQPGEARPVHRLLVLLPDEAIEAFQIGRYMAVAQAKFHKDRAEPR